MRRKLLIVALAVLLLGCVGAMPAAADDIPPPVFPSGLPSPSQVGNDTSSATSTPGPSYQVTPGSPGTALPAPQTPSKAQVDEARKALARVRGNGRPSTEVAAPVADRTGNSQNGGTDWWLIGSALLLVLVLTEIGRVNAVGARHRRQPIG